MNKAIPSLMVDFTGEMHKLISEYLQCKRRKDKSVEPTPLYYLWSREAMANDTTPYLMVLLLNNDVWLKWHTEFGHLNRGDMLTSEQHRCSNEKKKFQRRV